MYRFFCVLIFLIIFTLCVYAHAGQVMSKGFDRKWHCVCQFPSAQLWTAFWAWPGTGRGLNLRKNSLKYKGIIVKNINWSRVSSHLLKVSVLKFSFGDKIIYVLAAQCTKAFAVNYRTFLTTRPPALFRTLTALNILRKAWHSSQKFHTDGYSKTSNLKCVYTIQTRRTWASKPKKQLKKTLTTSQGCYLLF